MLCADMKREQAAKLLLAARAGARPVTPGRLGAVGTEGGSAADAYAVVPGVIEFGTEPKAQIPVVVEAWVGLEFDETTLDVCVNRTPVTGDIEATRDKRDIDIYGCGLHHTVAEAPKDKDFAIWLNITTPYMPITSDGKEPDLEPFLSEIEEAVTKAVRKAHRPSGGGSKQSQKDVVLENLDDVIAAVSGEEGYRFNSRQLSMPSPHRHGKRPVRNCSLRISPTSSPTTKTRTAKFR